MPENAAQYEIRFSPEVSRAVGRYVVLGFFKPRELPQALWRFLFTREFAFTTGLPVLLVVAGNLLPFLFPAADLEAVRLAVTAAGVSWLVGGLAWSLRLGTSLNIGCYALGKADGRDALVGGLRMKAAASRRTLCLAGALVDASERGKGVFTALMVAGLRLARDETKHGPVTLTIFAPTHPASKRTVNRYLGGVHAMPVDPEPGSAFAHALDALETELQALEAKGIAYRFAAPLPERGLFAPTK